MAEKTIHIAKYERILENAIKNSTPIRLVKKDGVNSTMLYAYISSKAADRAMLNFDEEIWSYDVAIIAEELRNAGIEQFTISVEQLNMTEILAMFSDLGIIIQGVIRVKRDCYDETEIPALLMKVC